MSVREISAVSILASLIIIVFSVLPDNFLKNGWAWSQDWMWIICASMVPLLIIYMHRKYQAFYSLRILLYCLIPLILQIAVSSLRLIESSNTLWIVSLVLQTWTATALGLMAAIALDRNGKIILSKRWMLLMALLFACALSAVYMFFMFADLMINGYPIYNYELIEFSERIEMNKRLMMPSVVAIFGSIVFALGLRTITKNVPKEALLEDSA